MFNCHTIITLRTLTLSLCIHRIYRIPENLDLVLVSSVRSGRFVGYMLHLELISWYKSNWCRECGKSIQLEMVFFCRRYSRRFRSQNQIGFDSIRLKWIKHTHTQMFVEAEKKYKVKQSLVILYKLLYRQKKARPIFFPFIINHSVENLSGFGEFCAAAIIK